jgi:hypothetical protein
MNAFWASVKFGAFMSSTPLSEVSYSRKLSLRMIQFFGVKSNAITAKAKDGSVLSTTTETLSISGLERNTYDDTDGIDGFDTHEKSTITESADGSRSTNIRTQNGDGTLRYKDTEVISANGRDKVIERDQDGDGLYDTTETLTVILHADQSRTSTLTVTNQNGTTRSHTSYTQSEDTLSRTILENLDGDLTAAGAQDVDRKTVDVTTIAYLGADAGRIATATTLKSVNRLNITTSVDSGMQKYIAQKVDTMSDNWFFRKWHQNVQSKRTIVPH